MARTIAYYICSRDISTYSTANIYPKLVKINGRTKNTNIVV